MANRMNMTYALLVIGWLIAGYFLGDRIANQYTETPPEVITFCPDLYEVYKDSKGDQVFHHCVHVNRNKGRAQ